MSSSVPPGRGQGSDVLTVFDSFRQELDDHNDRRERLIKASRDVTNASKKVIFLLHRIMTDPSVQDKDATSRATQEGHKKLKDIRLMFKAMKPELSGDRFWRYQHQVSPGLQEYIEALSFAHFLDRGTLITFDAVQQTLSDEDGLYFPLPVSDYLLGLSDLTGELMRYAISAISKRGGTTKAANISSFVRGCKADFDGFTPYVRDLSKKQRVTSQSLQKIEQAAYAIAVRTSEYDLPPDILEDIVGRMVSGFSGADSYGGRKGSRADDNDDDEVYD